jgi:hypothetical protein
MKKIFYTMMMMALCHGILLAQKEDNYKLVGQSPDGRILKMAWFIRSWDASVTGFDIKRRIKGGSWEKVNKTPVIPEQSVSKDLSNVEADAAEQSRLRQKLQNMENSSQAKEIKSDEYLRKLKSDAGAIGAVALITGLDFDMALLHGFGLVDRNIPAADNYEYGLFSAGSSKLLSVMIWKYGEKADLNIITTVSAKSISPGTKIQLTWQADKERTPIAMLAGFNIYRNGAKINSAPKMAVDDIGKMLFSTFDSAVSTTEPTRYEISAQSIFGIEGSKVSYEYKPSEHPSSYKNATLLKIEPEGANFSEGMGVTWTFPPENEIYLKGFRIEKADLPAKFTTLSENISPGDRKFIDKTKTSAASYIKFRVIAIYKDGTELPSYELLYYYLPTIKPLKAMNVKTELVVKEHQTFAKLSWDPKAADDTLTDYYQVMVSNPVSGKFMLDAGIPPIKDNSYMYEIDYRHAAKYKFGIVPISKYLIQGEISDTAEVLSPSRELPYIRINSLTADSNKVSIRWDYPDLWDIKGFRIYQNGNLVANELQVKKNARLFVTPGLRRGAIYDFSVQAVTEYGVESDKSMPSTIIIQQEKRR